MGEVQIQRLTPRCKAEYRDLMELFGDEFDERDTYSASPPSDEYVLDLLGRKQIVFLTASADGRVVGGLVAYVLEKFERERSEVYIYDLAVAKPYRRKGIATGLIQELKEISKRLGAWVIFVQADSVDAPAIQLYESLGSREAVLHFDIGV